jgi:two-component system, OmpR family, KDP operon response regulator KdpE
VIEAEVQPLIVLIEDEPQLRRFIRPTLHSEGYRLSEAETAAEGLRQIEALKPDLVLLDLGLPDGDGIEVTRRLRGWTHVPIIVISARGQEVDKVQAFDAGADDYLTKPFGVPELLARIRVALRHAARAVPRPAETVLSFGELRIDLVRREVHRGETPVHLTPHEYGLFALLARHAGQVVTYRQLLREVWGPTFVEHTHYCRVYMGQLRQKLEADPTRPRWLLTEAGVGYRLRDA